METLKQYPKTIVNKKMKAAIRRTYSPPNGLTVETTEKPSPKDDEVLIRVYASTVNRTDCAILTGKPFVMRLFTGLFKPKSPTTGTDFAGKIESIGKNVSDYKIGDAVFGFYDEGLNSHAEYMVFPAKGNLSLMPKNISFEAAAASLEGVHYAYNFIKKAKIKSGQKVLINGATGAIGSALLQFMKYKGLYTTAVCNTKNIELIKSLGADKIYDYEKEDFTKDQEKYDFICDAVGKSSFGKSKHLLKRGGIYVSSELGWMGENIFYALTTPFFGNKKVVFPIPTDIKSSIAFIKKLIEEGKFKAVIDRTYPLEDIAEAFTYVQTGQKTGNVVILLK